MFESWFLFPVGVAVAICAMSSGIGGSSFWTPIYLLWMGLEPKVAFWVSLLTMLFGFGSGVYRNVRDSTVNPLLIGRYLLVAGPATAIGAFASTRLAATWLVLGFAAFVLIYGAYLVREFALGDSQQSQKQKHEHIYYPVALVAGLLQGSIASGAGVLLMPTLLDHRKIRHHAEAVGSTVVLVFACSLISVCFRINDTLFTTLVEHSADIAGMIAFAAPGVIVGGQIGPRLAGWLPRRYLRLWVGLLLVGVGSIMAYRGLV